ncbi:MAG: GNAT family N-acetyltransferase [Bacteroidota bacterium]
MDLEVKRAIPGDLPEIYRLFEEAISFQKEKNYIGWTNYDKEFVKAEINNEQLFKIVNGDAIVCIFSVCYSDALIWREKDQGNAIYLHRVIVDRKFKGEKIFKRVMEWATKHARELKRPYIRIDTWADNNKIISYYKDYHFSFIENYTTPDLDDLPLQHRNLKLALLEYSVSSLR